MREFYTVNELMELGHPSLPPSRSGFDALVQRGKWRADPRRFRIEPGRGDAGGTFTYHISLFPADVRSALTAREIKPIARPHVLSEAWLAYDALPDKAKAEAEDRLKAVNRVEFLQCSMVLEAAIALVATEIEVSGRTIFRWLEAVKFVAKADRLPALAPRRKGCTATADCDPRAWDYIVADYLRPEEPCFSACFGRLQDAAKLHGWSPVPSAKTLQRRIEREIPRGARVLARKGRSEAQRLFPHQTRDRSVFGPLDAITADGHKFDVFVRMPDGEIGRPVLLAIQDLYSGLIVGWRLGETECWPLVRLAFLDMMQNFGIPSEAYLDNGRAFASKWLTGGMVNRYRFKVKEGEQEGLLRSVGMDVHWATPYHGQAKPIERAFRDLCEEIAKHPRNAGAYTGNNPNAKPDNYGSRAVAWDDFLALVASEIARHNQKPGRTAANCRGRSFAETYRTAAETAIIQQAGREQLRLFMLASDFMKCRPNGEVHLCGNRYWSEPMVELAGKKIVARFDPQDLHAGLSIYSVDGRFICDAACIEATGFNNSDAGRRHAADRRRLVKSYAELLDMERRLTIDQVADLLPRPDAIPQEPVRPAAVRLVANSGSRMPVEDGSHDFSRAMEMIDSGVIPFPSRE